MKRVYWQKRIVKACKAAGTYKPFFENVIDTLAGLMEMRDEAEAQYMASGGKPVVEHYNDRNDKPNMAKNPALVMILEINAQALNYWRDLGLTSKSWQAMMKEETLAGEKRDSLGDVLSKIGV